MCISTGFWFSVTIKIQIVNSYSVVPVNSLFFYYGLTMWMAIKSDMSYVIVCKSFYLLRMKRESQ